MTPSQRFYRRSGLRRFVRGRRHALLYHLTRGILGPLRRASLPRGLALADRVGDLTYRAVPRIRRLALDHLAIAFGDTLNAAARDDIARAAYRNVARSVVEVAKFDDILPRFDDYVSAEGFEHLQEVSARGRGGLIVAGHIGNQELLAGYVARNGIPLAVVAKQMEDPRINRLITDFRSSHGMRVILRSSPKAGAEILRVLKRGGVLGLQIDQDIRVPSVSVPFFGRLVRTPVGPAVLAVRRDLPVVLAFARRRPEGGHHFTFSSPILPPKTGDRQRDVIELTRRFSQLVEERIRANPAEWNWWHRRWRRPPVSGLDLDADARPGDRDRSGVSLPVRSEVGSMRA
jgi:KDO2-lipid IV(A) lauroyltransferase